MVFDYRIDGEHDNFNINAVETVPLLKSVDSDEVEAAEWMRLGRAIDRICRILVPLIYIIIVIVRFRAIGEL